MFSVANRRDAGADPISSAGIVERVKETKNLLFNLHHHKTRSSSCTCTSTCSSVSTIYQGYIRTSGRQQAERSDRSIGNKERLFLMPVAQDTLKIGTGELQEGDNNKYRCK